MAFASFLKINGITGDCAITGHEGDIEIIQFSQNFTYGKQRLDTTVDLFTQMDWENVTSQKVAKLKELRDNMPDFNELNKYTQGGESAGQATEEIKKKFTDWENQYQLTIKEIDEKWKNDNQEMSGIINQFGQFIKDYGQRLVGSKHEPIKFDKYVDSASPKILEACCTGAAFPDCRFVSYRSVDVSATSPVKLATIARNAYVEITLYRIYLTNYTIKTGTDLPTETIFINYDEADFKFVEADATTGKKGQQKIINWNWETGKSQKK